MDKEIAIKVEGLHKKFTRSLKRSMLYGTADLARGMLGLRLPSEVLRPSEFWALQDINFEIKRGEALGLIGSNGSGKTTLLRLLSGIFPPDKGEIQVRGRIGALIALGAGFHPHMTGRENIYLNGSILGMSRDEIGEKFQEIIDFADIGEFLDAPVSTYSSGMRVRLGFSVAIHSDPDIVLVDEILAVGDAAFRAKCMSKLGSFLEDKAVILVSHSMYQIESLAQKVLWLEKGSVKRYGEASEVVNEFLDYQEVLAIQSTQKAHIQMNSSVFDIERKSAGSQKVAKNDNARTATHTQLLKIHKVELFDEAGNRTNEFPFFSSVKIRITYHAYKTIPAPLFNLRFDYKNRGLFENSMLVDGPVVEQLEPGDGSVELLIERLPLTPKLYTITLFVRDSSGVVNLVPMRSYGEVKITMRDIEKKILAEGPYSTGHLRHGGNCMYVPHEWRFYDAEHRLVKRLKCDVQHQESSL